MAKYRCDSCGDAENCDIKCVVDIDIGVPTACLVTGEEIDTWQPVPEAARYSARGKDCSQCPTETIEKEIADRDFTCKDGPLIAHRGYLALLARVKTLEEKLQLLQWVPVVERLPSPFKGYLDFIAPNKGPIIGGICRATKKNIAFIKQNYTHWRYTQIP